MELSGRTYHKLVAHIGKLFSGGGIGPRNNDRTLVRKLYSVAYEPVSLLCGRENYIPTLFQAAERLGPKARSIKKEFFCLSQGQEAHIQMVKCHISQAGALIHAIHGKRDD